MFCVRTQARVDDSDRGLHPTHVASAKKPGLGTRFARKPERPGSTVGEQRPSSTRGRGKNMQYRRISADCHLDMPWMPPDLFVSEARRELKERMPYVEDGPQGPQWVAKNGANFGLKNGVGPGGAPFVPGQNHRVDKMAETGMYEDGKRDIRRCSDPHLRIKDMDRDGVDAEVIYGILGAASAPPRASTTAKRQTRCCASTTISSRSSAGIIPTGRSVSPACPMATS